MTHDEYYTAPPDHIFNEIKEKAIEIWRGYDDTYGYASGKIARILDIPNIQDNAWYIVAMFDVQNQAKLITKCSDETAKMIIRALRTPSDE